MTWLLPTAFVPPSGKVRTVRDGIESVAPQASTGNGNRQERLGNAGVPGPAVAALVADPVYVWGFRGEDEFFGQMYPTLFVAHFIMKSRREKGWEMQCRTVPSTIRSNK